MPKKVESVAKLTTPKKKAKATPRVGKKKSSKELDSKLKEAPPKLIKAKPKPKANARKKSKATKRSRESTTTERDELFEAEADDPRLNPYLTPLQEARQDYRACVDDVDDDANKQTGCDEAPHARSSPRRRSLPPPQ
eukprot:gene11014-9617_t